MNSPPSNSREDSAAFSLLDERIQRWIWQAGWTELKDIQEQSIPLILEGKRDIIISAATASGKTEAAFFPILTRLLAEGESRSCAIYISPLKALINDQWNRLEELCRLTDIPVIPWHGDSSETRKKRFIKDPHGCLLITPESLEGMLIRHGHALSGIFGELRYIVIDELHAFIDTERGKQLQSLIHRIEYSLRRKVPRIGLSATLGEMQLAAEFLRPGAGISVCLITSKEAGQELRLIVKGYNNKPFIFQKDQDNLGLRTEEESEGAQRISKDIFSALRGFNNLIFPNSRGKVELYSDQLRRLCDNLNLPNEFWAHHGSLSKEVREEAEKAIKLGDRPTSIVATTTLELGIDIGKVKSIAQIGPAPSVTSLRQRLGRSGRRKGEPAILRCYCLEDNIAPNTPTSDKLREGLVQTIAQIHLLLKGWYEPPRSSSLNLSTLIQQLLSLIAQFGGITANQAWVILCQSGVFAGLSQTEFLELLQELGTKNILMQDNNGLLLLGPFGERIVNHYSFLAAFNSDEEFRVVCAGKTLGALPLSRPIEAGSYIIFAGRRWKVMNCRPENKLIEVEPAKGGKPPAFNGMGGKVHDGVRQEMRNILSDHTAIPFLDKNAARQLEEARLIYDQLGLRSRNIIQYGKDVQLFSWLGDWVNDTLVLMLHGADLRAVSEGLIITVLDIDRERLFSKLLELANRPAPEAEQLSASVQNAQREKWDMLLSEGLLHKTFASRELDVNGAMDFVIRASRSA